MGRGASRSSFTASIASLLVGCLAVRELRLEPLEPLVTQVVGDAGRLLTLRVEGEQLARQLAHRLAGAVLEVLPRLAAELGQYAARCCRRRCSGETLPSCSCGT